MGAGMSGFTVDTCGDGAIGFASEEHFKKGDGIVLFFLPRESHSRVDFIETLIEFDKRVSGQGGL